MSAITRKGMSRGSRITQIGDSSASYAEGGVKEASHFAKGDGWKPSKKPGVKRAV